MWKVSGDAAALSFAARSAHRNAHLGSLVPPGPHQRLLHAPPRPPLGSGAFSGKNTRRDRGQTRARREAKGISVKGKQGADTRSIPLTPKSPRPEGLQRLGEGGRRVAREPQVKRHSRRRRLGVNRRDTPPLRPLRTATAPTLHLRTSLDAHCRPSSAGPCEPKRSRPSEDLPVLECRSDGDE